MTPQKLKNSILQLAIQGKLVPQDPSEGTGEELYKQIQAEKAKLIKEGKIKKEKPLPEIAEDEIPFEIPEGWKWIRLGFLLNVIGGISYDKKDVTNQGFRILRGGNIQNMKVTLEDNDVFLPEIYRDEEKLVRKDDILIVASTGSKAVIGKAGYVDRDIPETMIGAFLRICRPIFSFTVSYLRVLFESDFYRNHIRELSQGTNINNVKESYITQFVVPLPPLAEQKRIVAKIEELLPLIDRYEEAYTKLEEFKARFPIDMQKSLLQMAIQGKLVPQDPSEGTGEELYRQIQIKRKALEDKRIIKKQPVESVGDDFPFEIPESWKWIRIGSVEEINLGFTYRPEYVNEGVYFLSVKDISDGKICFENAKKVSIDTYNNAAYGSKPKRGDILFGRVGTMGKPQIVDTDIPFCIFVSLGFFRDHLDIIDKKYVSYWMQSKSFDDQVDYNVKGSAQKNLNTGWLKNFFFPLPPLAEQKRIVAKLEEILPLCERLK